MRKYKLLIDKELLELSRTKLFNEVGTVETGNNRGEVVKYLKSVGLGGGNPYCMAGQYWTFVNNTYEIPIPKTALVWNVWQFAKRHGKETGFIPEQDDLIIWQKKSNEKRGHIERIIAVHDKNKVETIGFNTKNYKGTERDGEGVFRKTRYLNKDLGNMRIVGLIGWTIKKNDIAKSNIYVSNKLEKENKKIVINELVKKTIEDGKIKDAKARAKEVLKAGEFNIFDKIKLMYKLVSGKMWKRIKDNPIMTIVGISIAMLQYAEAWFATGEPIVWERLIIGSLIAGLGMFLKDDFINKLKVKK